MTADDEISLKFSHFHVQCDQNSHFFAQINYFARVKVIHIARGLNLTTTFEIGTLFSRSQKLPIKLHFTSP